MAFPTIADKGTTHVDTANETDHVIDAPSNLVSGDLWVVLFSCDGVGDHTWPTSPAFTRLVKIDSTTTSSISFGYRICNGSDGASMTIVSGSEKAVAFSWRIPAAQWHGTTPPEYQTATGSDAAPDPPNLIPSWGAEDTLWIAFQGTNGAATVTGYPASYVGNRESAECTGAGLVSGSVCTRELNNTSDNPGAWTQSGTGWAAATIAIRPAGAATGQPTMLRTQGIPTGMGHKDRPGHWNCVPFILGKSLWLSQFIVRLARAMPVLQV